MMFRKVLWSLLVVIFTAQILAIGLNEIVPGEYYNLTDYERLTGKKITKFNESPMLKEMVEKGLLPPVEERLPKNPVVVTPYESIGKYGGTWNRAWYGLSDEWNAGRICYEFMVISDKAGKSLLPDVLESLEVSKDGREYTMRIRRGLKWSDGEPVTTKDVEFWYHDILLNESLTPSIPSVFQPGGKVFKLEIVDDYTFKVIFEEPYPLFPFALAGDGGRAGIEFVVPSHYIKKFHPKYIGLEQAEKIAKENGYSSWYQFVSDKCLQTNSWLVNPDLPILFPWKLSKESSERALILERNPYYFKVDPEGNQLPYIDRIIFHYVENQQMLLMKAISGEIDMQGRHLTVADYSILAANREKGGYKLILARQAVGSADTLMINQNYTDDPVIGEILRDPRFRQAISLAVNREEIWQLVYQGLGEPRQASFVKGVKYYDPEWEKAFAEYNPERANQLLDEMGLKWNPSRTYRLRPDGKKLEIVIEYTTPSQTREKTMEMVKSYLEKVGISVILKPIDRSLYVTRLEAGQLQIGVWEFDRNIDPVGDPAHILGSQWAPLTWQWYNSGKKTGMPPEEGTDMWKLYEIWDQIVKEVAPEKRDELMKEIINLHKKNIWMVGFVGALPQPIVVKENFKNVPQGLLWDFPLIRSPKNFRPEQFYFE
ncbi:oligopeptide ABC transporter, periplasmic oligopeptide-binding protein [Thermotoga maritima MSB8]|uniref:Oligopeptide ABC transporter, periplasmic oligopeptide-binding protein n=2 Tax=Thermotogaceae TaxID=188709 RepID=Q9X0F7_THEMA|nr:oligopeptide ABC transporter, periplasmic oligopeptide-binding protein [Thermotoga maritima MSB8]